MAFKVFNAKEKIENSYSTVAEPMWSDSTATLTTFFTGSTQNSNNGKYYNDIYTSTDETKEVQFAVTYGHRLGYGSEGSATTGTTNPTQGIYSQLRQVLLPAQTTQFDFSGGNATTFKSDDVFAVVANRARYREKMDPGNWELHLSSGSGNDADIIKLIDDSGAGGNSQFGSSKREFNIVSGSVQRGIHTTASSTATATNSGSYGLFYPETGMIILNPNALASGSGKVAAAKYIQEVGTSTTTNNFNHRKLFDSIKSGSYFASRREEQKRSSFYFCNVLASEYNHSQNPSFFTGDNAALVNSSFITEPNTYITSVGLYNDDNELLAVAKLSKPFQKDQNTEALIKVRLDY
tara:strand:+ start:1111 stop:2160 length:1050 start_codon:yes stop_codon:yes gene_type:complete